jgi:flagellar protein FliO/FliZ
MKSIKSISGAAQAGAHKLSHAAVAPVASRAASAENTPVHLGGSSAAHHASTGAGSSIVRTIVGLLLVIAVIYGIAWILRQFRKSRTASASGSGLAPIASMPLGSGRSVQLVRAGRELLLLGVAEHGVTKLRTYTEAEALEAGLEPAGDQVTWPDQPQAARGGPISALRRLTVRP